MSSNNGVSYISVDPSPLRKPYGGKRISLKLSFTADLQQRLAKIGVIQVEPYEGVQSEKQGMMIARKGGYGSAFMQFSAEMLLALLTQPDENDEVKSIADVCFRIEQITGNDPDKLEQIVNNLERMLIRLEKVQE